MSNPARLDLTNLVAGDDISITVTIVDDTGTPVDLTGRSYVAQIRKDPTSTTSPDLAFTCTTPTPANGEIQLVASDTATSALSISNTYWWSLLEVVGSVETTLMFGRVTVMSQIAKV